MHQKKMSHKRCSTPVVRQAALFEISYNCTGMEKNHWQKKSVCENIQHTTKPLHDIIQLVSIVSRFSAAENATICLLWFQARTRKKENTHYCVFR